MSPERQDAFQMVGLKGEWYLVWFSRHSGPPSSAVQPGSVASSPAAHWDPHLDCEGPGPLQGVPLGRELRPRALKGFWKPLMLSYVVVYSFTVVLCVWWLNGWIWGFSLARMLNLHCSTQSCANSPPVTAAAISHTWLSFGPWKLQLIGSFVTQSC